MEKTNKQSKTHRTAYVKKHSAANVGREGVSLWAYVGKQYIGRMDMTDAGIAIYSGRRGNKQLCNLNWEPFFLMVACMGKQHWDAKWRLRRKEGVLP